MHKNAVVYTGCDFLSIHVFYMYFVKCPKLAMSGTILQLLKTAGILWKTWPPFTVYSADSKRYASSQVYRKFLTPDQSRDLPKCDVCSDQRIGSWWEWHPKHNKWRLRGFSMVDLPGPQWKPVSCLHTQGEFLWTSPQQTEEVIPHSDGASGLTNGHVRVFAKCFYSAGNFIKF